MTDTDRKSPAPFVPVPAGNTATGILKLIALVFMFIDHSGKVLFNNMTEMRTLGRIAFPIYIWCMVVGFYRTRNVTRYLIRIMLVGLVSQPLYLFALDYQGHLGVLWQNTFRPLADGFSFPALWEVLYTIFMAKPNIFLTLLMGLLALCAIREKDWLKKAWIPGSFVLVMALLAFIHDKRFDPIFQKISGPFAGGFTVGALWEAVKVIFWNVPNYFFLIVAGAGLLWQFSGKGRRMGQIWGPVAMILLATVLKVDYGWRGVLFFILIYAAQNSRPALAAVMVSFLLFWGSIYSVTASLLGDKIKIELLPDSLSGVLRVVNGYKVYDGPVPSLLRSETYALMGLPLILIRFPKDLRLPKWLSYLLYPGHLILLIVLKIIIFGWSA